MPNPVRIYVLHHPDSKESAGHAASLTNRIYEWFRMPSMEGIPVYVRSLPEVGSDRPAPPARKPGDKCLEYLVPLVDAHLVRDPVWHDYLSDLARQCQHQQEDAGPEWGWTMFPVALDSTAFNLSEPIPQLNFIRYGIGGEPKPVKPDCPTPDEAAALKHYHGEQAEELLKHLTEAMARDLTARLIKHEEEAAASNPNSESATKGSSLSELLSQRFRIFISYARADSTAEAKVLRDYIQGQTQCQVFFDENDIGFGQKMEDSLGRNLSQLTKAMIVLNSDRYADRPWCRWEIRKFTEPRDLPLGHGKGGGEGQRINLFYPVLVVDNFKGAQVSRLVPELAQAPVVRWVPEGARQCFSVLMREVLLGLRDVLHAQTVAIPADESSVVVNRLPGPLALGKLLSCGKQSARDRFTVYHPGHGLPLTELGLLEEAFPRVRFKAFRDVTTDLLAAHPDMKDFVERLDNLDPAELPLRGKTIAISTAHNAPELAAVGLLPQHQDEALVHLLRPLVRMGADLLHGGKPPRRDMDAGALDLAERDITWTLMQLLGSERGLVEVPGKPEGAAGEPRPGPVLFNISAWPSCRKITPEDEATWIKSCRVHRVLPEDAGLSPWTGYVPLENEPPTENLRRYIALTLGRMRQLLAEGFECAVPGRSSTRVRPAAFIFIGGVLDKFRGVLPGVMEEFLCAACAKPAIPIYLIGGLGGATGVLAKALLAPSGEKCPQELSHKHYLSDRFANHAEYRAMMNEFTPAEKRAAEGKCKALWSLVQDRRREGDLTNLFSNGLSDRDNRDLLTTDRTIEAIHLIWKGLNQVLLHSGSAGDRPRRRHSK